MPPQLTTPSQVFCARCVPADTTGGTGWQRSSPSPGQRVEERRVPLKAVAPGSNRSGLQPKATTTRPLTWRNEGRRPCCRV